MRSDEVAPIALRLRTISDTCGALVSSTTLAVFSVAFTEVRGTTLVVPPLLNGPGCETYGVSLTVTARLP